MALTSCFSPRADTTGGDPELPASGDGGAAATDLRTVVVQHVLIAHNGTGIAGVTRNPREAEQLAQRVLARARRGESFDRLVRLHSDESRDKDIYDLTNYGVPPSRKGQVQRVQMVRGFGDVAFKLRPLEIGLVPYDEARSPYGWHVIKRLR